METTREELLESLGLNRGDLNDPNLETTNYSFEEKEATEEPKKAIRTNSSRIIGSFKDYDTRVWGEDIFIHSNNLHYWGGEGRVGLQCDFDEDDSRYQEIQSLCDEIREKMLQLNELVK